MFDALLQSVMNYRDMFRGVKETATDKTLSVAFLIFDFCVHCVLQICRTTQWAGKKRAETVSMRRHDVFPVVLWHPSLVCYCRHVAFRGNFHVMGKTPSVAPVLGRATFAAPAGHHY